MIVEIKKQKTKMLKLNIKRKYLDQIVSGDKTMEYREATGYWHARLKTVGFDLETAEERMIGDDIVYVYAPTEPIPVRFSVEYNANAHKLDCYTDGIALVRPNGSENVEDWYFAIELINVGGIYR